MKGIELCAECAYYSMKTHKCKRGCIGEPNQQKGDDVRFFTDCPLPEVDVEKKSEWIKCSERIPEEHEDVLVAMKDGEYKSIHVGYAYNGGDWMIDGEFWYEEDDPSITHWMPLPDPPKEVDEDGNSTKV